MTMKSEESHPLRVRVLDGPLRGATVPVGRRLTIGRASGSDVLLLHDGVSRQHAQITTDEHGRHVLIDLESSNGTFVDGQRIRRHVLTPGTVFKIIRLKLVYERAPDVPLSDESGVFAVQPVDRRMLRPTINYDAADLPRPKATPEPDPESEPDAPVARAKERRSSGAVVQALGAERHRIVATRTDGTVYEHSLIDDIVEMRALRAHRLRGDQPSEGQRERLEQLGLRLTRHSDVAPSRRRFERFSCHFPAKIRFASGHELSIAVLDIGANGTRIRAYDHDLGYGELVWLAIYLVTRGRPQTVVFTGRVEWTRTNEFGLSFSGAPGWESRGRAQHGSQSLESEEPTQRQRIPSGGMVLGRVRPRIHSTS